VHRTQPAAWPAFATLRDLGSPQSAGTLSGILFFLCGLLVAASSAVLPAEPGVRFLTLIGVGLAAAAAGVVIFALPWARWNRSATLWLVPFAFALIAVHNWATGENGLRYDVFFLVVAAWIGLMHPTGTTLGSTPVMVAAYVAPAFALGHMPAVAASLTYAVPTFILIGECASLVAEQARQSARNVVTSERRWRALVQNSTDAICVVDATATITWESPGITFALGYTTEERIGTNGLDYVHPDQLPEAQRELGRLLSCPDATVELELQVRHRDGTWRWCELSARNLLDEPAVHGLVVNVTDVTERHRAQAIQRQLAAIVEATSDAVIGQTVDGTIMSWNSAAERMYGYPAEQMIGANIRQLVPSALQDELSSLLARVAAGEQIEQVTTMRQRSDGTLLHIALSMSPLRDGRGQVAGAAAIARDISADVRAAEALRDTAASFQLLFSANPEPMWVYDVESLRFLEVNEAAIHHYGFSRDQFLAMSILDIRPAEEVDKLRAQLAAHSHEERHMESSRHRLADGRLIDVEVTAHRLTFAGRPAALVAIADVTDRNVLESQLRHQAFHDSLTGLSNRALFSDRVEHALGRRTSTKAPVVLLLDLDRFKVINDSLGHAVGDELLIAVAHRLQGAVRVGDTVARLGGDEFAVLLDQSDPTRAEQQAVRLLEALSTPVHLSAKQVVVSGSVGIAVADPGVSAGELLRNADMAMYRAKADGGASYRLFEPDMHADALRQMEVTASLREAIATEQFVLHYQPVVEAASGDVVAMEALVRWWHDDELHLPAKFIPALEDSGLIVQLGGWIIRRACADASVWPDGMSVNVNLSGRQLLEPDLLSQVRDALAATGLPPHRLMLEITESVLMHKSEATLRRLRELRELGVGLAIDDFGTGYSSLSYLRDFDVDELKLDKSFVEPIGEGGGSVLFVATIVQLAHSLGLTIVAEGVETQEQYDVLRELHCDRVQGFYVARPQPVQEAIALSQLPAHWHTVVRTPRTPADETDQVRDSSTPSTSTS
jgi:diguanylate cyclase (GGDEF)-like protein/PAS domain S-box-containing protein